ncbi:methyltransferase [Sporosarcina sp. NCCP-2222]|uniref:class I SAM-dependent methyltransferase n=1 Tax=Sporosarcina sp. NCCP-2222 TaxID=2935073 RepID=UPI002085CEF8|nr:class I SAM-dependent methyltransferase [Sporosarcina sp. NCCP-2222]GKV54691.1 methyltransferase [Sporosarcina sp. NCCP-2222]
MEQKQMSKRNQVGWNQYAYEAWVRRHGSPSDYAKELQAAPADKVMYYLKEMGEVNGKRILNPLGSKGNKAVCFALLGAEVTVVDLSEGNRQYAMELAEAAGVPLTYIVGDLLDTPLHDAGKFDFVLLEMGVLHYFAELPTLFKKIASLLATDGIFLIREYHPYVAKVMCNKDGEAVFEGNYFDESYTEEDVAYASLLPESIRPQLEKNLIRRWTIAEVINSLIVSGFHIVKMKEDQGVSWAFPKGAPAGIEDRLPGTYALIAVPYYVSQRGV